MLLAAEQSSSAGVLIEDKLQLGDGGVDVVFGCETKETGEIFNQEADGIMGLGNSEVSLVNQASTSAPLCAYAKVNRAETAGKRCWRQPFFVADSAKDCRPLVDNTWHTAYIPCGMQLAQRGIIQDVFSLCFGSVEGDGALLLGDVALSQYNVELEYTPLLSSPAYPHYYSVQLMGLAVGANKLDVAPVWYLCSSDHLCSYKPVES